MKEKTDRQTDRQEGGRERESAGEHVGTKSLNLMLSHSHLSPGPSYPAVKRMSQFRVFSAHLLR